MYNDLLNKTFKENINFVRILYDMKNIISFNQFCFDKL